MPPSFKIDAKVPLIEKKLKIKNPFYGLLTSVNFEKWHATCNNAGFVWINIPFY
jgi:hypothetical protein